MQMEHKYKNTHMHLQYFGILWEAFRFSAPLVHFLLYSLESPCDTEGGLKGKKSVICFQNSWYFALGIISDSKSSEVRKLTFRERINYTMLEKSRLETLKAAQEYKIYCYEMKAVFNHLQ